MRAYMSSAKAEVEAAVAEGKQMKVSLRFDQAGFSEESRRVATFNPSNDDGQVSSLLRLTRARLAVPPASLPESLAPPAAFSASLCAPRPTGRSKFSWRPHLSKVGIAGLGSLARNSQDQ